MHTNQVTDFDEGFKPAFIENLESFTTPKIAGSFRQLMLTEGTKYFFDRSNSYWIAQEIVALLPEFAKTDEDIFIIKLHFNEKKYAVLSVIAEDIGCEISLPDFPIQDRDFKFYLYRDQGGIFNLMLLSELCQG